MSSKSFDIHIINFFKHNIYFYKNVFWCTVPEDRKEHYNIGINHGIWGVEEEYRECSHYVKRGDYILFYVSTGNKKDIFSLCEILSDKQYYDDTPIWSDELKLNFPYRSYPYRLKIAKPRIEFEDTFSSLGMLLGDIDGYLFDNIKQVANSIRGENGIYRELRYDETSDEKKEIFNFLFANKYF